MVQNKEGKPYDRIEYYAEPHKYSPVFFNKYVPYLTILYHTIYWD